MAADPSTRSYRLEPLDATGLFLGLGLVQCTILGAGLTLAVVLVTAHVPMVLAAAPVATAVALCFGRVRGHATWEWLPLGLAWTGLRLRRRRRWVAPLYGESPHRLQGMPPCLEGIEVISLPWRSAQLGAVRDHRRGTLTALVPVAGAQFLVASRHDQDQLLHGWGDVLAHHATERSSVTSISWVHMARPTDLTDHRSWVADRHDDQSASVPLDSYEELIDLASTSAVDHRVIVTITVARDRLRRRHSADHDGLEDALRTGTESLLRGLRAAGLQPDDPLGREDIVRLVRSTSDLGRPTRRRTGRLAARIEGAPLSTIAPMAVEVSWSHLRVDCTVHRTWWVSAWPRVPVAPDWLEPFLTGTDVTRTTTVVAVPVTPHRSRRRIERDLVKLDSDAVSREERGRRVDARHRRATQALLDREDELVAGYPEMSYLGLVTVAAPDLDTLEVHSEIVEQLANEHGIELRVLHARQDLAWAAALPLGLAPRTLVAS